MRRSPYGERWSRTSPKENRRACLCKKGNTYSRKCCKGNMINQGIGLINGVANGSFNNDFNDDFNNKI